MNDDSAFGRNLGRIRWAVAGRRILRQQWAGDQLYLHCQPPQPGQSRYGWRGMVILATAERGDLRLIGAAPPWKAPLGRCLPGAVIQNVAHNDGRLSIALTARCGLRMHLRLDMRRRRADGERIRLMMMIGAEQHIVLH